jgi:thioredoxin reductase
VEIGREGDTFVLTLADGRALRAARVVLATGVRDELPDIPGLQPRWGKTVLHCPYCHGYEVADQPLGVLAGGPMSVHQAQMIPDWGPTSYFTQGVWEPDAEQVGVAQRPRRHHCPQPRRRTARQNSRTRGRSSAKR